MAITEITDINLPELSPFASLTEAQLRQYPDNERGIFIAESPKVITTALERGYRPLSILCERKHITGDAAGIIGRCGDIPVYTGTRELLASLTGYKLTRGVLCAMERPELPDAGELVAGASLVGVLQNISDTTNIGAIFRSASALGVDCLLLTRDTCDPLNRRAVRVSMGTVFTVPWTFDADPLETLADAGFKTASLALTDDAISLDNPVLKEAGKLALFFGTEGDGLPRKTILSTDWVVKIPMMHGVDSLNVAAAAAVAFWELRRKR